MPEFRPANSVSPLHSAHLTLDNLFGDFNHASEYLEVYINDNMLASRCYGWNVSGLEMEGAHYQKAIQAASKLRKSIAEDVKVRYAYYASDNPLETGSTLASGGLGTTGVKPTYLITEKILEQIFNS